MCACAELILPHGGLFVKCELMINRKLDFTEVRSTRWEVRSVKSGGLKARGILHIQNQKFKILHSHKFQFADSFEIPLYNKPPFLLKNGGL